jgi:hypothetical protein
LLVGFVVGIAFDISGGKIQFVCKIILRAAGRVNSSYWNFYCLLSFLLRKFGFARKRQEDENE